MKLDKLFHEKEIAVQNRAGVAQKAHLNRRVIGDTIPARAIPFIQQQRMVVISSMDNKGNVWASLQFGSPGFARAPDDRTLVLDLSETLFDADDPLWQNLKASSLLGMLFIDFVAAVRLRVNGRGHFIDDRVLNVDVAAAYPNCPRHIQRRTWKNTPATNDNIPLQSRSGHEIEIAHVQWIRSADTFFVASAHPTHGLDASHRGGRPGFAQVQDTNTLLIPDYAGNNLFNTLGNFESYPHAGLIFIDFDRNCTLQVIGRPKILWDIHGSDQDTGGTCRYWQLEMKAWRETTPLIHAS